MTVSPPSTCPQAMTTDPIPQAVLGRKARREASSSVSTRYLHLKERY